MCERKLILKGRSRKSEFIQNGFISIECIVSLSIICVISYLISTTLNNSYNLINKNGKNIEMLSIAKKYLEDEKYNVQNDNEQIEDSVYDKVSLDGYTIETKLDKDKDHYECYRVSVSVEDNKKKVELSSYVTKK